LARMINGLKGKEPDFFQEDLTVSGSKAENVACIATGMNRARRSAAVFAASYILRLMMFLQ
jgi:hypothetical protein